MIYIAKYAVDDYTVEVFASKDKETVEKWVDKFNIKLAYWKEYYSQFSCARFKNIMNEKYYNKESLRGFYDVMEVHKAFIQEIELR